jgi:flagellar protein FlaG
MPLPVAANSQPSGGESQNVDVPAQSSAPVKQANDVSRQADAQTEKDSQPKQEVSKEFLDKTIEQVNKSLNSYNRQLNISVHERTKKIMVKVMDTQENKVIREIPPEKVLDAFARTLELAGILMDKSR